MLTLDQGKVLVRMARHIIKCFVCNEEVEIKKREKWMDEKRGVFVTIHTYPENKLRGCIGLPYPEKPLHEALVEAALGAAQDPRFKPLEKSELEKATIEVSILSVPEEITFKDSEDLLKKISKGNGLIIRYGPFVGLFLPQVWEEIPSKEEFLDHLCMKASLPPGFWRERKVKLYKFKAQIFKETEPNGNVIEVRM